MKRFLSLIITILALAAACNRTTPEPKLIGITCSRSASGASVLPSAYSEAISKAGGIPVVIPTVSSREEADAVLSQLYGIVFSGGVDVNPAWYGEEILNETVTIDAVRDHSDSLLACAAVASRKPILAICRGEQLINVILGGSLYQDIPAQVPETVGHSGGATHKIGLEEGSVLARLFGPDSLEVNSYHHQAVKDPAPGIRVTARSADGIVEAFENEFITAVQFHPEKSLQQGEDKWLTLFAYFVNTVVNPTEDSSQFVSITDVVPDAILEIRYHSTYNFVGKRIDGYEEPTALLTRPAAEALKAVSDELIGKGYRLKIYDAYRPQKGVDHFVRWAADIPDTLMRAYFYPDLDKSVLFDQLYIMEKSGHTRGSTVDLTLFDMHTEKEVDMGGTFDWFGPESHPDFCGNPETGEYTGDNSASPRGRSITPEQFANRMLLRDAMVRHGFKTLESEWWHFTLENEPYPDTYFTFPVKQLNH